MLDGLLGLGAPGFSNNIAKAQLNGGKLINISQKIVHLTMLKPTPPLPQGDNGQNPHGSRD